MKNDDVFSIVLVIDEQATAYKVVSRKQGPVTLLSKGFASAKCLIFYGDEGSINLIPSRIIYCYTELITS